MSGRRPLSGRRLDLILSGVLLVASMLFVGVHVAGHQEVSPFDEYQYIDYYVKVLDQGVVRQGEKTGDYARQYLSCHNVRILGGVPHRGCAPGAARPDKNYPWDGTTVAGIYPPPYFVVTRVLAQPFYLAGMDLVSAGRLVSGLWLAAAAVVLFRTLRRLECSAPVAFAVSLALAGMGSAQWANTYISTDATALFAGAAMLWLAVWLCERASLWRMVALAAASGVFTLTKLQSLAGVAIVTLALCGVAAHDAFRRGGRAGLARRLIVDRRAIAGVAALVVGVLSQAAWLVVRSHLALGEDPPAGRRFELPDDLVAEMLRFFPNAISSGALGQGPTEALAAATLGLLVVGGVVGLALGREVEASSRILAWSVLVVSFATGPALSLAYVVTIGAYPPLVPRYGLALVPAMLACVALLLPRRGRLVGIGAVVVASLMFTAGLLAAS